MRTIYRVARPLRVFAKPEQYEAILFNVDHSQTHLAFDLDVIRPGNFNVNYGGREGKVCPHTVVLEAGDLGNGTIQKNPATKNAYKIGDEYAFELANQDTVPFSAGESKPTKSQYVGKQRRD